MIISCTGICCKVSIQIKWDINFIVDNFVHHGLEYIDLLEAFQPLFSQQFAALL